MVLTFESGFDVHENRWATKRTKNVEALQELWAKQPNRVEVLVDPKLKNDPLVILKKEHLNRLIEKCAELSRSTQDKKSQTETLLQAIDLLTDLVQKNSEPETLKQAVSVLSLIRNSYKHN